MEARGTRAYVKVQDKSVPADSDRFGFRPVEEYFPVFISIRGLNVHTTYVDLNGGEGQINNRIDVRGSFESAYRVEDVFLVLEMSTESAGKSLFLLEVGTLEPHNPMSLSIALPLKFKLGDGQFKLHLFAHGAEVFHSEQPFDYRENKLDQMIAKRVVGAPDGQPQPFVGPTPEYPAKLREKKIAGTAVITLRIGPRGSVLDPVVKSASDPAFGEAALVAVRQWRFIPRIREGHPVEAKVDLPFTFSSPKEAAGAP